MQLKSPHVTHLMTLLMSPLIMTLHTIECSENGCLALCSKSDPPPDSLSPECPLLPSDCVVTTAPCYCNCAVCRRKLGEPCSESKPLCEDNLICVNAEGLQKEDLYWWNIFNGGTCQLRNTDKPALTDPRHIVTYIFIIVSIAVLLISLSYICYIYFRQRTRRSVSEPNEIMTSYDNTAAELLLNFFCRFGKTTVRNLEHPIQQSQSEQSELQLLRPESDQSEMMHAIQNADQEQEPESSPEVLPDVTINVNTAPPPYSDELGSHCLTILLGVALPEYAERSPISRPPSYDRIDEIL